MKSPLARLFCTAIVLTTLGATMGAQGPVRTDAPRPIDAGVSLWAEELTWMEIRDLVKAGTTTIIIGTGGVEQNGPYVAGGKHNFVLQTVLPYIARAIPNSLIAPIVKFVPEGRIEPTPSGHMSYPGTISLEAATFEALLTDICRSYKAHGFTDIILVGDSGGNQGGMRNVAGALNRKWAAEAARVHFLPEYYDQDRWSYDYLKTLGVTQINKTPGQPADARTDTRNGMHDDIYYESQIAVLDPKLIRADERRKAGLLSLHGVDESPMAKTIEIGKKLAEYRGGITAQAFKASQQKLRAEPAGASQPARPEATSLLGKPLVPAPIAAETRKTLEENLKQAEIVYGRNPDDPDATIWLGRRLAYLGRYREAIEHFSDGVEKHPDDARMYRHRGHRYITVRELPKAIADFSKAAQLIAGKADVIEPDGQPNARNTPTSTLNSNIYYHLGLAHYASGDFGKAADAYKRCLEFSKNPDMLSATTYWYYLTLARLGRMPDAAALLRRITPDMDIIENASYHRLLRMFKGELTADSLLAPGAGAGLDAVTTRYGVAAWHLANGRQDRALALLREIVDGYPQQWPAFGYVAAEADLARLTKQSSPR